MAVVKATILETGKPNIQLAFKLRKQKDNTWAAYDMLVEGISLLDAKKSELEAIVESRGLGYVNDMLAKSRNACVFCSCPQRIMYQKR